jgi:hypothetical protein
VHSESSYDICTCQTYEKRDVVNNQKKPEIVKKMEEKNDLIFSRFKKENTGIKRIDSFGTALPFRRVI